MRLLSRYIGVQVFIGTALALGVLLSVFSFIDFIEDLDTVGQGSYTVAEAMLHSALTMPTRAFALFPPAALIGTLLGLGTLATSREIVVMRAAGISIMQIVGAVMKAGLVLVLVAVIVGELVAPYSEQIAQVRRNAAVSQQLSVMTRYGSWLRDGLSFINIRRIQPDEELEEVFIYNFNKDYRLRTSTRAAKARHQGDRWLLQGIAQSSISPAGVETRELDQAMWESRLLPDLVNVSAVEPESLSAVGLVTYLDYLRNNGLATARFELALWNKIVYPLATAIMIFLAAAMVLSRNSPMAVGQRVVVGALIGVGFHILHNTSVRVGLVYEFSPIVTALLPSIAFLLLATSIIRRSQ